MKYFCIECGKKLLEAEKNPYMDMHTGDIYFTGLCDNCYDMLIKVCERIRSGI